MIKKYVLSLVIGGLFCMPQIGAMEKQIKRNANYALFKKDIKEAVDQLDAVILPYFGGEIVLNVMIIELLTNEAKDQAIQEGLNFKLAADIVVRLLMDRARKDIQLPIPASKVTEVDRKIHNLVYRIFKIG